MKRLYIFLILSAALSAESQILRVPVDSSSVAFKAKLFTVSDYGVANREAVLNSIESQELTFLRTIYKKFLFMKIDFSQPYYFGNDSSTGTLIRNCSYYMAYNTSNFQFFRLGGFDSLDIDSFFDQFIHAEELFYTHEDGNEIEGINIHCLYSYYNTSKKKRDKKGFTCFDNCSKATQLSYGEKH